MKKTTVCFLIIFTALTLPFFALAEEQPTHLSSHLTQKAWDALADGHFEEVHRFCDDCIKLFADQAKEKQSMLRDFPDPQNIEFYQVLNDVGTCLFLKGRTCYMRGENKKAREIFQDIIDHYSFAQCWDEQGWYWKVDEAARDQIVLMECGLDFGDYTSQTLTAKAWSALNEGRYDECLVYARKCVHLYMKFATDMQSKLENYPEEKRAFDYWALNDVGTCYFIMGEAYMAKKDFKKAKEAYENLASRFSFAQCWDPAGQFFWKPARQASITLETLDSVIDNAKLFKVK